MLDKLKKYKYFLLLLVALFILFLPGQTVNAETNVSFTYNDTDYNAVLPADDFTFYTISRCSDGNFWINATKDNSCVKAVYIPNVSSWNPAYHAVRFQNSSGANLTEFRYFSSDLKNWTLRDSGFDGLVRYSLNAFCYSNIDVYNTSNNIIFKKSLNFPKYEITLSTNDTTYDPIYAYSNYFDIDDVSRYECYISDDNVNYQKMHIETMNYLDGTAKIRFYWKIYFSGTYYFKFVDKQDDNKETYVTFEVTNILKNSSNSGYNIKGIPQPFVTFSRVNEEFLLQTQSFDENSFNNLECYYTTDVNADKSTWSKMHLGTLNNVQLNTTEYYFYFTVPKDSQDTTYYFVFYDTVQKDYGYISSLECIFDNMNDYADKVGNVTEEKKSKLQELLDFFKERFGFLSYPFEFIINLLQRVLNINYGEPVLHFPQITNPLDDTVIFEGFDYNLKSILEFEGISYFYNIYLIAVDALLIFAFIKGCIKTFEEVSSNG